MSEKGAGGVDGGGCMGHTRANSDGDTVSTTESGVETTRTRGAAAPADGETEYAQNGQPLQELPRRFEERTVQRQSARGDTPSVSRNPSSSSTRSDSPSLTRERSSASTSSSSYRVTRQLPIEPPVTKATLSELDVGKIIHNPKLRHDINFDPELHFRPNLDGEKGRRKQERCDQFWAALQDQLVLFVTDRESFTRRYGRDDDWCLPQLLKAVKEIIQTLVPSRDREYLDEGLNVELLMQQFNRGVADLERLAAWLSSVLKLHCAPMRDDWVDKMYQELSNGNRTNDIRELVNGMRDLLSVLEVMKLDVANHQIRSLRPMLIEDTVHFEQRFFFKKIQSRRMDVSPARAWYSGAARQYSSLPTPTELQQAFGDMGGFFYGLCSLVLPSSSTSRVPPTFLFDEERLMKLRSDMVDAICLDICMRQYEDLERVSRTMQMMPHFFNSGRGSGMGFLSRPTSIPAYLVEEDAAFPSRASSEFNFNSPPSRPSSLALSISGSAGSSPRNSGGLFAQASAEPPSHDARANSARLHASLMALLQTSMPTGGRPEHRWRSLVPAISVEIMRFANAPHDLLPTIESKLQAHMADFGSESFDDAQHRFHSRLFTELGRKVREFKHLTGLGLFSVATGSRLQSLNRLQDGAAAGPHFMFEPAATATHSLLGHAQGSRRDTAPEDHGIEDMAARLAHLGLLHWRVWAQLVYQNNVNTESSV